MDTFDLFLYLYFFSAIFFVVISFKCFFEKVSIPKIVLIFLISPTACYIYSYLVDELFFNEDSIELNVYAISQVLIQIIIQLFSMFLYIKLVKAKNTSISVFVYLCCICQPKIRSTAH
jgi:hypothetical protein